MADKIKPFEEIFPYLSYRWRYDDGEYSPYAPFTEVQFLSVASTNDLERYEDGFNVFMTNDLDLITITAIPKGREDVVAVDILYTESISSTIYVLKTIEIPVDERDNGFIYNIKIPRRALGSALVNDQLNRHFDNVPLKAKAQEITANRLMYGNYLHKFNQGDKEIGKGGFSIETGVSFVSGSTAGPSVKTNRNYEVGVIYIDKYGRQGSLLTQKVTAGDSTGSLIKTNFTYSGLVKLNAKITSNPPPWAVCYRYFIKDTSGNYENLTAFNSYIEGSEGEGDASNVYVQFDSKDRNKITEDSFLMLRRSTHDTSAGTIVREQFRQPVLDIENEAPDIVKQQLLEREVQSLTKFSSKNVFVSDSAGNISSGTTLAQNILYISDRGNRFNFSSLNAYISSQNGSTTLQAGQETGLTPITIDCTGFTERLLLKFKAFPPAAVSATAQETQLCLVDEIELLATSGSSRRNLMKITLSNRITSGGTVDTGSGISKAGITMNGSGTYTGDAQYYNPYLQFSKIALTEEAFDKLKGSFFVKIPRRFNNPSDNAVITSMPVAQTALNEDGDVEKLVAFDFETDSGEESNLDLYWESSSTFDISADHGKKNIINWSNCIARVGGSPKAIYLESTKILDKFNGVEMVKSIRVNTPEAGYAQERRKTGLIFSGIFNSKTGINELNQFNMALNPTKELEPNYGGIQKLFTLDTNLLAFAEDKVFKVLADKDALFNADDSGYGGPPVNVTATSRVLGQAMVYQGQYGISTHPESFAFWGNNAYFTDAKRGAVMQLTPANGQLFPISSRGMSNFFRDRIGSANKLIGAYDGTKKQYVLSMQGYDQNAASIGSETIPNETSNITLGYSSRSEGWTSRFSFIPESGITMNNKFYTFKNGKAYLHNSDTANRNNFYGTAYDSNVQIIFNDNPTYISDYLTLNYEGDSNWEAEEIISDQDGTYNITNVRILDSEESGFLGWFLKEGKYHGSIVGTQPVYIIDPGGSVGADGFWPLIQDGANTQDISGTKGFFAKVRFKNSATTKKELFAISSEYYISQT